MDNKSKQIIDSLIPSLRKSATDVYNEIQAALTGRAQVRFIYGLRTIKEQNDLYALGRTVVNPDGKSTKKPMGNIVTNARALQSIHNYGMAIDIVLIIDGKTYKWDTLGDYDGDGVSDWMECVKIFEKHGWEAGIRWRSFPDAPHFQYSYGFTWQQLKARWEAGNIKDGYVNVSRTPVNDHEIFRTTASVNLRSGASTNDKVKLVVLKGESVRELSRSGDWSKVVYNGTEGYISNKYLTR